MGQVSGVTCHVSCVGFYIGHLSLTPTVTATDLLLANSPTMYFSRLVHKDPKRTPKKMKMQQIFEIAKTHKTSSGVPILPICSSNKSLRLNMFWQN